jgi:hypothetical protein
VRHSFIAHLLLIYYLLAMMTIDGCKGGHKPSKNEQKRAKTSKNEQKRAKTSKNQVTKNKFNKPE